MRPWGQGPTAQGAPLSVNSRWAHFLASAPHLRQASCARNGGQWALSDAAVPDPGAWAPRLPAPPPLLGHFPGDASVGEASPAAAQRGATVMGPSMHTALLPPDSVQVPTTPHSSEGPSATTPI